MLKKIYKKNLMIANTIRYGESLLKKVYPSIREEEIFRLLTETWSRPYVFENFTHFKERPYTGKYVNVDHNGFRISKNQAPWPPDRKKYFITYIFGGSTAFGYGVPDDQTIASHLQDCFLTAGLERDVAIYNFGRGHYYSTQERILFEQLITARHTPDIALFIDGLNEFFYYNDEGTAVSASFERYLAGDVQRLWFKDLKKRSPVIQTYRRIRKTVKGALFKENLAKQRDRYKYCDQSKLIRSIERYIGNKEMIEAISSFFGVKPIFVWQPVPTYQYNLELHPFARGGFGRHGYSAFGYPLMLEYVKNHPLGEDLLWCAHIQEEVHEPLYVDIVHYSPMMSKRIAKAIYDSLVQNNFIHTQRNRDDRFPDTPLCLNQRDDFLQDPLSRRDTIKD